MKHRETPSIAITTDVDALAARAGESLDVEADVWRAWDAIGAERTAPGAVLRLRESVGANHKNEMTNLLVILVGGPRAERTASRLAPALEAGWGQRVLVEGAAALDGSERRLRRASPVAPPEGPAEPPRVQPTKPRLRQHSGYTFAVEAAPADIAVRRAVVSGDAPNRKIIVEGAQDGLGYEMTATEVSSNAGTFSCVWTSEDGDGGTATLDLLTSASGDLALIGSYTAKKGSPGFWAFHLFPDDDDSDE